MQKKNNQVVQSTDFPEDVSQLTQELTALCSLIASEVPQPEIETQSTLALAKVVPGLSKETWSLLASEHGLQDWLALSLNSPACANIRQLQTTLEHLTHQSEHDPLTGLPNRRSFERKLEVELERVERSMGQVSLAILDIDNFKQVNDTYGHPCGDEVLVGLAQMLHHSKRAYDVAARIGGEEFALILPGASPAKAQAILERILTRFAVQTFHCDSHTPFACTFSAGVSAVKGRLASSATDLVSLADKALYAAKEGGKNQVHVARLQVETAIDRSTMVHSNEKQFLFSTPE